MTYGIKPNYRSASPPQLSRNVLQWPKLDHTKDGGMSR